MSPSSNMKAIVINDFVKDFDEITVAEVERPVPNSNEVLVQVKAAGINYVDTLYAKGKHQNNQSLVRPPFILGLEFSGVIVSAPSDSGFRPGDRVFGGHTGSYSEFICLPRSDSLHHMPAKWTFPQAAGLAATLPVSFAALMQAGIKAGQTVLVHAAAGGLGTMAVQIAAALGCRVIGTAGSQAKCTVATRCGAHACVNYLEHTAWWEQVLELTDGKGADIVFDPVGLVDPSLKCIAHRGKVLVVGFAGIQDNMERVVMNRVLLKQVSLIGYRYGESSRRYPQEQKATWDGLEPLMESGSIQPVVYDTHYDGLHSVPRALRDMVDRKIWGKAIVTIASGSPLARL
ncbi:zeta-crystallin [Colletotrichum chrysophilum]|uniref:Zeta-crystallin n=1 Tax=Colletotrichum chrysophilum TaxID=1836956 RepID=A0AAD9A8C5_9PEZI|nr:zeta-crystallin [Colletotrichum chrysophilum]